MNDKLTKLRAHFQALDKEAKAEYLRSLQPDERLVFTKNPDLFLFDKQIIPDTDGYGNHWLYCLLRCGRSFGKDIAITTEIPTPNGWKTMNDLQVGDQVFGEDGKPTTITYVSPVFHNPCYQLTFSTGETVIAGQDHQWLTHTYANRKSAGRSIHPSQPTVKTTKELFETQRHLDHESNHSIPISKPLQYSPKPLPIDPYVLGCWLGDGSSATGNIECADQQILDEISKLYTISLITSSVGVSKSSSYRIGKLLDYQMPNGTPHKIGELTKSLQENNLLNNKHIPNVYLQSNIEQRMCLLQGLMDTDGSCDKRGVLEFCNTNKLLAEQTYELILSLGLKATIHQNESWLYDKRCKDRYRIYFQTDKPVFRLDRKTSNQKVSSNNHRYITKIELVPTVPTKCISVDNSSHLYLITKSCIPTHNTYTGAAWVAKKIREGAKMIGLCGPTYDDVSKVMVPAILKWFLPEELEDPAYNHQTHTIRFKNGTLIYCYTSEKEIRGPNLEYLWCDEICVWADGIPEKIKIHWEDIARAVRIGKHPQIIITSTPKTHPFFIDFADEIDTGNTNYYMIQGSMLDNITLPQAYIDEQVKKYGDTARGRQEIYGDLIRDSLGAYWTHALLDQCRADLPAASNIPVSQSRVPSNAVLMGQAPAPDPAHTPVNLVRTIIGFDPSVSKGGDECGILVGSLYSNKKAYIIGDYSGHYDPGEWSKLIAKLYKDHNCSAVVVENNIAGNTLEFALRTVNAHMNIIPIHTNQGKTTRAEHCAALYTQGKVFHTSCFKLLEDQMCSFSVEYSTSPDRLDALGHMLTELFWPTQPASFNTIKNLRHA